MGGDRLGWDLDAVLGRGLDRLVERAERDAG